MCRPLRWSLPLTEYNATRFFTKGITQNKLSQANERTGRFLPFGRGVQDIDHGCQICGHIQYSYEYFMRFIVKPSGLINQCLSVLATGLRRLISTVDRGMVLKPQTMKRCIWFQHESPSRKKFASWSRVAPLSGH